MGKLTFFFPGFDFTPMVLRPPARGQQQQLPTPQATLPPFSCALSGCVSLCHVARKTAAGRVLQVPRICRPVSVNLVAIN